MKQRIPVHIVSGFLGSGKTTFLNRMLRAEGFAGTAVIINEFGETGLDHLFIEGREDGIFELSNGCLCCTIRAELAQTLLSLPRDRVERVIVETTGLADPGPVLQAIIGNAEVANAFEAGSLLVLADALNLPVQLDDHAEARMQIALADRIIVTKLDMLAAPERAGRFEAIVARIRALNALSPILAREDATFGPSMLDGLDGGSAGLQGAQGSQSGASPAGHHHHLHASGHGHDVNRHGDGIRATVLRSPRPMPRSALEAFCELLTSAHALALLRLKGMVAVEGCSGPLVVHAVHGVMHEPRQLGQWPDADTATRIVVIVKDLDPAFVEKLFAGFANISAPDTPDRAALTQNPLAIPGYRLP